MAERYVMRCDSATLADGMAYERAFPRREEAERLKNALAKDTHAGICQGPHEVVRQVWTDGKWVDCPEVGGLPR